MRVPSRARRFTFGADTTTGRAASHVPTDVFALRGLEARDLVEAEEDLFAVGAGNIDHLVGALGRAANAQDGVGLGGDQSA